jgi:hypothetical protein
MPYWQQWDGSIPAQAIIPLTINLLLIALESASPGISTAGWLIPAMIESAIFY